jgi:hypothetical protein
VAARQILNILTGGQPTADAAISLVECKLAYVQVRQSMQGEIDRLNSERLYKDAEERRAFDKAEYLTDLEAIYKLGGTSDDHIVTLTDWPVLYDERQELYYSVLPDNYVNAKKYQNLPGEEQIRSVEPMRYAERRLRSYRVLAAGERRLLRGLQGHIAAEREGARILYYPELGQKVVDKTLLIKFVLRPVRDQLPAPGLLLDAQDDMIIPKAVALLTRRAPVDSKNDANPTL